MSAISSNVRILVLDDQLTHANAVKAQILAVSASQWSSAGGPAGFQISDGDVDVSESCAAILNLIKDHQVCPYDVIIADVNMGSSRDEGALAVISALEASRAKPRPCVIAMTQYIEDLDSRRQEIERIAYDAATDTPVFVISKYKTLDGVQARHLQLDALNWRDLVLRAIIARSDRDRLKHLNHDADLTRTVGRIEPLRQVFQSATDLRRNDTSLIVIVGEPLGLQVAVCEILQKAGLEAPESLLGYDSERSEKIIFGEYKSLANMSSMDGRLILDADQILMSAIADKKQPLLNNLIGILSRSLPETARGDENEAGQRFKGLLVLGVSPETDRALRAGAGDTGRIYERFPRLVMPEFGKVQPYLEPVLSMMLRQHALSLDPLDEAVMKSFDWQLGFPPGGPVRDFEALRHCIAWARQHSLATRGRVPSGLIANELTLTLEARRSIYGRLPREALLLYVLERVLRSDRERATLTAVAFLYYRTLATEHSDGGTRQQVLKRLWAESGPFDELSKFAEHPRVRKIMTACRGKWPDRNELSDQDLYRARPVIQDENANLGSSVGDKMLTMLRSEYSAIKGASPSRRRGKKARSATGQRFADVLQLRAKQLAELRRGQQGRPRGNAPPPLDVLDAPFFGEAVPDSHAVVPDFP